MLGSCDRGEVEHDIICRVRIGRVCFPIHDCHYAAVGAVLNLQAEIIDHPNVTDPIPESASSQLGERGFTEIGTTARMTLGAPS